MRALIIDLNPFGNPSGHALEVRNVLIEAGQGVFTEFGFRDAWPAQTQSPNYQYAVDNGFDIIVRSLSHGGWHQARMLEDAWMQGGIPTVVAMGSNEPILKDYPHHPMFAPTEVSIGVFTGGHDPASAERLTSWGPALEVDSMSPRPHFGNPHHQSWVCPTVAALMAKYVMQLGGLEGLSPAERRTRWLDARQRVRAAADRYADGWTDMWGWGFVAWNAPMPAAPSWPEAPLWARSVLFQGNRRIRCVPYALPGYEATRIYVDGTLFHETDGTEPIDIDSGLDPGQYEIRFATVANGVESRDEPSSYVQAGVLYPPLLSFEWEEGGLRVFFEDVDREADSYRIWRHIDPAQSLIVEGPSWLDTEAVSSADLAYKARSRFLGLESPNSPWVPVHSGPVEVAIERREGVAVWVPVPAEIERRPAHAEGIISVDQEWTDETALPHRAYLYRARLPGSEWGDWSAAPAMARREGVGMGLAGMLV